MLSPARYLLFDRMRSYPDDSAVQLASRSQTRYAPWSFPSSFSACSFARASSVGTPWSLKPEI